MIRLDAEIKGRRDAVGRFRRVPAAVRMAALQLADRIHDKVVDGTPIDTGELKASWGPVTVRGSAYTFENNAAYAHVLEYGLYPGVGPKTTVGPDGGIYSTQAVGGMVRPVIESPEMDALIGEIVEKFRLFV